MKRKLAVLTLTSLGILCSCQGRSRTDTTSKTSDAKDGAIAVINLSGGAPESPVGDGFFPAPAGESFVELIRNIESLEGDKSVRGIFVKLRGEGFPFSQAREIGETLAKVRGEKMPVVCHTHEVDNATFWMLSRACTEIWVSAAGDVPTVGIGAELAYVRGALDKVGIYPDMLAMGKYKSGGEALTHTEPSEDSLGNLKNTLSDLRSQWLDGIAKGYESTAAARKKHVEDGPWTPKRAQELGLIHKVGFEDQALKSIRALSGTEELVPVFGEQPQSNEDSAVADLVRMLAGAGDRSQVHDRIAVVPAVGSITMGADGPFGGGDGITAASMTRTLRRLREDDSVRAVVMRMDSPGGSPLASDLIWREMMLMREKKPIIVSIGGMSASGGYYIASGATKIVASPSAIVGSIGVFGGKIVLGGALSKVGITNFPIAASPEEGAAARANINSLFSPWDDAAKERVRASMQRIYDLFVERVAEGRDMPADKVYATAQGEIYLATVGKQRGLIDELGGISRALEVARQEAGLKKDIPVEIEGAAESLLESLFLGSEPNAQEIQAALTRFEQARIASISRWALGTSVQELKPFAAVLAPLFAGESVVVALPYTITIH